MEKTNIKLLIIFIIQFSVFAKAQITLKLEDCIEIIEKNNFDIKQASYEIEITKELMNEAKKSWIPNINAYLTNYYSLYSHNHELDEIYFHLNEENEQLHNGDDDHNDEDHHNHSRHFNRLYSEFSNEMGIESNILIFNFNTQKLKVNKSRYELLANLENLQLQKNTNTMLVIEKYFNVLISQEIVKISISNLENLNELLRITTRKYEVGVITKFELMQVKQEYYNAYYVLGENKLNLEKEKFKLINFLQLNIGTDEIILEPYNNWGDETFLFDENKMDIYIKNYPSIKYEQNKLEALRTNTNILKNNLKPKIYGSYSIGTNYFGSLNNLLKSESLTLQWQNNIINKIGVGISIPILNKYSDKSLIIQSKINENIQSNNISKLVNNLSLQIKDIYINYKNNKNLLEIEKNRISISNEVYNMSVKAFDAGTLNIYDVNKSRLDNFTHNVNYTKLEFQNALYKEVLNIYLKK